MDRIHIMREAAVYFTLTVVVSSVLAMQIYKQSQDYAFYADFDRHASVMDQFLAGWDKYDILVGTAEVTLKRQAKNGTIPPFSCEAVFIREHIVSVN